MTSARSIHAATALALPLLLASACVDDVGRGKVAAEVTAPTGAVAPVEGRDVAIDVARSRVHALGAKVTRTHDIVFDAWEGTLRVSGDDVVGVDVTVQVGSLRADVPKLTAHLRSPDFFDVERFPTARFRSTRVVAERGADGSTHRVTGDLTMRGVTRQVTFPAAVAPADAAVRTRAEFVIDRRDFGIVYPGMPDDLIQDDVVLTIDLVAPRTES